MATELTLQAGEITFQTDVRVDTIVEIAEFPVRNVPPIVGQPWARIEGCTIFRSTSHASKVRTSLTRAEIWGLIEASRRFDNKPAQGWITVPFTLSERGA